MTFLKKGDFKMIATTENTSFDAKTNEGMVLTRILNLIDFSNLEDEQVKFLACLIFRKAFSVSTFYQPIMFFKFHNDLSHCWEFNSHHICYRVISDIKF